MDRVDLDARLEILKQSLQLTDRSLLKARLEGLKSAFPFNEYEYCLMFLLSRRIVSFEEYESLRIEYVSGNPNLNLFELSPRVFGEIWGHAHILDLDPRFKRASNALDPTYSGEYDLWIDGIRVEVKAARAINTKRRGGLVSKALRLKSKDPFWMNFQQLKPNTTDVFVLIGVWVDAIHYWVLSSREAATNQYISHQHRGGVEYQIGITHQNVAYFDPFLTSPSSLGDKAIEKGKANHS